MGYFMQLNNKNLLFGLLQQGNTNDVGTSTMIFALKTISSISEPLSSLCSPPNNNLPSAAPV